MAAWSLSIASYDLYWLWRDGVWHSEYSVGNAVASSVVYLIAGLVWNLDLRDRLSRLALICLGGIGVVCLAAWVLPFAK